MIGEPLLEAALTPLGEVLRLLPLCVWRSATWQFEALPRSALIRDEPILEEPFHVMSDHRIRVEPIEYVFGGHVVHDLMIQFLTDVERQTGDFAFSCSHLINCGLDLWFLVLGSWFLVLGSWFLVLGSWFLVLG